MSAAGERARGRAQPGGSGAERGPGADTPCVRGGVFKWTPARSAPREARPDPAGGEKFGPFYSYKRENRAKKLAQNVS